MATGASARTAVRHRRSPFVGALVLAIAALVGVLAYRTPASSSLAPPPAAVSDARAPSVPGVDSVRPTIGDPPRTDDFGRVDGLGADDGAVPDGVTVFDEDIPAVAGLDRSLLEALRRAATDAAAGGIEMVVNSGWRSPEYQQRLVAEAVSRYGSTEEAARWVASAETSAHVSGEAIDIGPSAAAAWLSDHGPAYGLCQIYRNEPWHFELRPAATDHGCPSMYADATHDPRVQQ